MKVDFVNLICMKVCDGEKSTAQLHQRIAKLTPVMNSFTILMPNEMTICACVAFEMNIMAVFGKLAMQL